MSLGNTTEIDILKYILNGTAPAWAGNGSFYLGLHSADVGEGGSQTTNEIAYGSYARIAIARTSGGFTATGNPAFNTALVQAIQSTSDGATITHWSLGTASSGAGQVILKGALDSPIPSTTGIQPQFPASALTISVD